MATAIIEHEKRTTEAPNHLDETAIPEKTQDAAPSPVGQEEASEKKPETGNGHSASGKEIIQANPSPGSDDPAKKPEVKPEPEAENTPSVSGEEIIKANGDTQAVSPAGTVTVTGDNGSEGGTVEPNLTDEEALERHPIFVKADQEGQKVVGKMEVSKREYYRLLGRIYIDTRDALRKEGKGYAEYLLPKLAKSWGISESDLLVAGQFAEIDPGEKSILATSATTLSWRRVRKLVARIKTANKFRAFIKKNPDIDRWSDELFQKALNREYPAGKKPRLFNKNSAPPSPSTIEKIKQKAEKERQGSKSNPVVDEASKTQLEEMVEAIQARFPDIAEIVSECEVIAESQGANLTLKLTAVQCTALHVFVCGKAQKDGENS